MNKRSLLELAKKLNIPHRNCMKTKEELEEAIKGAITEYKQIFFSSDTPACIVCLDELRKQQIIDQKIYDQRLMEDTVTKLAWDELQKKFWWMVIQWLIKEQVRCRILKLILHVRKINFKVFVDHKITCCTVEEPHILNGTGTLVPEMFAIFCKKSFIPSFLPCSSNFL